MITFTIWAGQLAFILACGVGAMIFTAWEIKRSWRLIKHALGIEDCSHPMPVKRAH